MKRWHQQLNWVSWIEQYYTGENDECFLLDDIKRHKSCNSVPWKNLLIDRLLANRIISGHGSAS